MQWVFFIDPYTHADYGSESARLVAMAYPAADVLLLVMVAQLLVGPGGRARAYKLLVLSIGLWVVADEIYGLDIDAYAAGSWLDSFWLASYVCWGAAALDPSMARLARCLTAASCRASRRRAWRSSRSQRSRRRAPSSPSGRFTTACTHTCSASAGGSSSSLVLIRLAGLVHAVERARRSERVARHEAEQAQQLLAYQNQQLVELDTLKDEFVSSVSHELRTPLTSISGYVELLLENEAATRGAATSRIVERNAERLLGLVSDLLFTARLQDGRLELERVDGRRVAPRRRARSTRRRRAREAAGVELRVDSAEVARVDGEPVRLAQLLDNLVSNAIKFTPGGGRVTVGLTERQGIVRIEVSDTGIGIPEDERERLFERFFRSQTALERQIQGTGLGLYISKAIVDAHGGRIGVQSTEGRARRSSSSCLRDERAPGGAVRGRRRGHPRARLAPRSSAPATTCCAPRTVRRARRSRANAGPHCRPRRDDAEADRLRGPGGAARRSLAARNEGDSPVCARAGGRRRPRHRSGRGRVPREAVQGAGARRACVDAIALT